VKIPKTYHSALSGEAQHLRELDRFETEWGLVFCHDITTGATLDFVQADCLYVEPAWQRGYEEFQKRAGQGGEAPPYKEYITAIRTAIEGFGKPSYVVGGKHMLKLLAPEHARPTRLNGFDAQLMMWNCNPPTASTALQVQDELAKQHDHVLDFCCGYGLHLTKFKRFTACDINRKCVYYVAHSYMGYDRA